MADYTKYTNKEMQAITLAQQITNDNIAIVGTGLPLIGASVAKRLFAPKCAFRRRPSFHGSLRMPVAEHPLHRLRGQ